MNLDEFKAKVAGWAGTAETFINTAEHSQAIIDGVAEVESLLGTVKTLATAALTAPDPAPAPPPAAATAS